MNINPCLLDVFVGHKQAWITGPVFLSASTREENIGIIDYTALIATYPTHLKWFPSLSKWCSFQVSKQQISPWGHWGKGLGGVEGGVVWGGWREGTANECTNANGHQDTREWESERVRERERARARACVYVTSILTGRWHLPWQRSRFFGVTVRW